MRFVRFIKVVSLILTVLVLHSCYEEIPYAPRLKNSSAFLALNYKPVFDDSERGLMLFPVDKYGFFKAKISRNFNGKLYVNSELIADGYEYDFGAISSKTSFEVTLVKENGNEENFHLYFTLLPLIKVEYNYEEILDEPKLPVKLTIVSTNRDVWCESAGIEIRGGSSTSKPKKSYGLEIWDDCDSRRDKNISLFDMYRDDDWILDALYADSSRIRNRVSFDLWNDMQVDAVERGYQTKYSGIKGRYIELFLNNDYQGLYCLNERVEAKMLQIKKEQTGQQGYLYKSESWSGATTFSGLPELTIDESGHWSGWEQKYPDPNEEYDWEPLFNFVDFVVNSANQQFKTSIGDYFVLDQAIDFYILVNLIKGADNVGKNIFLSSESGESPFYISPWDMDATWGRDWLGYKVDSRSVMTLNLYRRIIEQNPEHFRENLKKRYTQLREEILTHDALQQKFHHYFDVFEESGVIIRENERWPESTVNIQREMDYLSNWSVERFSYLDNYFQHID